jgi:hypothetical protein
MQLLGGSAVVSTAVFGVPPKTFLSFMQVLIGVGEFIVRLAGGTPARATETVALPIATASFRLRAYPQIKRPDFAAYGSTVMASHLILWRSA